MIRITEGTTHMVILIQTQISGAALQNVVRARFRIVTRGERGEPTFIKATCRQQRQKCPFSWGCKNKKNNTYIFLYPVNAIIARIKHIVCLANNVKCFHINSAFGQADAFDNPIISERGVFVLFSSSLLSPGATMARALQLSA